MDTLDFLANPFVQCGFLLVSPIFRTKKEDDCSQPKSDFLFDNFDLSIFLVGSKTFSFWYWKLGDAKNKNQEKNTNPNVPQYALKMATQSILTLHQKILQIEKYFVQLDKSFILQFGEIGMRHLMDGPHLLHTPIDDCK